MRQFLITLLFALLIGSASAQLRVRDLNAVVDEEDVHYKPVVRARFLSSSSSSSTPKSSKKSKTNDSSSSSKSSKKSSS
eukprot:CAMPEP_0113646586 /NCGR_PEP_ID=MMETSP0017_2-20120614/24621_1 /TAXON_ID=2856 /ORGANISM="Cylindrotheca closterium" /LENGTH=78 /DNA_ID=CAMNT_0000558515 /DNA_START=95 /DNA_END=328 /DNA_ORIENTATION=- /assembly_acc=CAM_ASM_000147